MTGTERIARATADELSARSSASEWAAAAAIDQPLADRLADEEDGPLPEGWERTVVLGIPAP